jgi:serine/threonine protein kinase
MTRVANERTVPDGDAVEQAAKDVADGRSVDWEALVDGLNGPEVAARMRNLRVIDAIAGVHRAGDDARQTVNPATRFDRTNPPPEGVGEPWGKYRLLERVGSGSFGSVYRAWDPDLQREVAIKILHPHVTDEELKRRLLIEGRALAQLDHDNVVDVYDVPTYGDRIGLCMEFVVGETLEAGMDRGHRLNPREAIVVGQDVCRALAAVHGAGLVHRDVTARNIMRRRDGRIVVMDFGTGLRAQDVTGGPVNIAGTPLYMAPEVLAGQPPSFRSDVYSIGVLLYYLVTGKFPVEGRNMADLRAAHMVGRRTSLRERAPDLPAGYIKAVEHALIADPLQRCPSPAALLEELEAVLVSEPTQFQYVVLALEGVLGAFFAVTVLGVINSRVFNHTLGRSDFANESIRDWFSYGMSATIAPVVIFTFVLLALSVAIVAIRLLVNVSRRARAMTQPLVRMSRRCRLDDVTTLSSVILLLSASVLIGTWWYFGSFIGSLIAIGNISTASGSDLAFLSPQFRVNHELYRKGFIAASIVCVLLWYPAVWLAKRKGEPINRIVLAGGVIVLLVSILLLDFPYRLLARSKRDFEAATFGTAQCYVLGEKQSHILLFCPEAPPDRNRIVRADDPNLKKLGVIRDIFTSVANLR